MRTVVWRVSRRSLDLASVRYRALLPAVALEAHGYRSIIADAASGIPLEAADIIIFTKSFSVRDIELATRARASGKAVFADLCDHVFIDSYGSHLVPRPAEVFTAVAAQAHGVSCTTEPLAQVLRSHLPPTVPVTVIPDSIETPQLLAQEARLLAAPVSVSQRSMRDRLASLRARMARAGARVARPTPSANRSRSTAVTDERTILWFGNHGSPHGDFGLSDILRFADALVAAATERRMRLLVVSNHRERFQQLIEPLALTTEYREWSPEVLTAALGEADVVIVPNSLDEFSICKSANRSVLALQAGVPVVATDTPALALLRPVIWTEDPLKGIRRCLDDPAWVQQRLQQAGPLLERYFGIGSIGRQWADFLAGGQR